MNVDGVEVDENVNVAGVGEVTDAVTTGIAVSGCRSRENAMSSMSTTPDSAERYPVKTVSAWSGASSTSGCQSPFAVTPRVTIMSPSQNWGPQRLTSIAVPGAPRTKSDTAACSRENRSRARGQQPESDSRRNAPLSHPPLATVPMVHDRPVSSRASPTVIGVF
jgi:hypothetical protein